MNRYRKIAIVGLLAVVPMLLAASGGFPSRPTFQAVGVGAVAPATGKMVVGNASVNNGILIIQGGAPVSGQLAVRGITTGVTAHAYAEFQDSAGTLLGWVGDGSGGTSDITLRAAVAGANVSLLPGAGGCVQSSGSCLQSGSSTRVAYGKLSSTCVLSASSGVTSAASGGTGICQVNLTLAGFTSAPECTASPQSAAAIIASTSTITTQVDVVTVNTAAAATAAATSFACLGT